MMHAVEFPNEDEKIENNIPMNLFNVVTTGCPVTYTLQPEGSVLVYLLVNSERNTKPKDVEAKVVSSHRTAISVLFTHASSRTP